MPRLFQSRLFSLQRALILDTGSGRALRAMIAAWKTIPDVQLSINTYQLPATDCSWLKQDHPDVCQVNFDPTNQQKLLEQTKSVEGYSIITTRINVPFDRTLIAKLSSSAYEQPLKILGQAGSTVSHIDLAAATAHDVAVTYTPGANANAVAEFVLAQIFNLTRTLSDYNQRTQAGVWSKYLLPSRDEVSENTLGLIGFGYIARCLSVKAIALGLPVVCYARTRPQNRVRGVTFIPELSDLLKQANIISLHVPFSPDTKGLIGKDEIDLLPQNSYIINTSRGGIVDEFAVAQELKKPNSRLAGVAFDVFENEGDIFTSPLQGIDRAQLTPHIAGTTNNALINTATKLVNNIAKIISGSQPFLANREIAKQSHQVNSV